ncbi:hypothetical protein ACWIUD_04570 [Helicobacter sp. 23-1044]
MRIIKSRNDGRGESSARFAQSNLKNPKNPLQKNHKKHKFLS